MRTATTFIFSILLSITNYCDAQTFSVKDLIGTKWEQVKDYEATTKTVIEFTDKDMIEYVTFYYDNKTRRVQRPYYFSPTVPASFDKTKVGKTTTGKYLVLLYKFDRMDYKTIKQISKDTFITYHRKTNAIGGNEQTFVYKRIR